MAGSKVNIDSTAVAIAEDLAQYSAVVGDGIKTAVDSASKGAKKELSKTSPINPRSHGRTHYRTLWRTKTAFENRLQKRNTVYNEDYRLPHLLEKSHQTRSGKRSKPQAHIAPAEERAIKAMTQDIERVIQNGGK